MDDYFEDSSLLFQSGSQDDWTRARAGALVQGVICAFKNCSVDLIPFEQVKTQLHLVQRQNRGLQEIELDNIRGSVGRYRDFTSAFLPRGAHLRKRWELVSRFGAEQGIPPIEVYKVGEAYFVVDGNHRVSTARQAGMETIPAYVSEYKTSVELSGEADLAELMTKSEYLAFLKKTRLGEFRPGSEILFTTPGRYEELEQLITVFRETLENSRGEPVTDEEALLDWFDLIYIPAIRSIRESGAMERFPGRTEADLFIWMWQHQDQLLERYPESSEENNGGNTVVPFLRRLWRNIRKLS
jgi:hypothetical protein